MTRKEFSTLRQGDIIKSPAGTLRRVLSVKGGGLYPGTYFIELARRCAGRCRAGRHTWRSTGPRVCYIRGDAPVLGTIYRRAAIPVTPPPQPYALK